MANEEITPQEALWLIEAARLVIVDGTVFVIHLKGNDDITNAEKLFDPDTLVYDFAVRGPVGNDTTSYVWFGAEDSPLIADPGTPDDLTKKANQAFHALMDWDSSNN
jgi:hypothetical protein